ncbi:MAG TPA: PAS domain S-box protein [Allosphingosinicella sp.]|nr:PAS domain S-box protein [Allosphingosinicella sp.]
MRPPAPRSGKEKPGKPGLEPQSLDEAERLRQLFDNAPGFMAATHGPSHIFDMANASYREMVGHRHLIGRTVREAFPELADQGFFELLDKVYKDGTPMTGRARPIRLRREPDGPLEERMLDFAFQPVTDRRGKVVGIFADGYDVTDRVLAEEKLRESEERFRLIADSAPVPMWVTKLDRRRSFVNRAYVDFLGITYEQAVDYDWRDIIHPDHAERVLAESVAGEATLELFVLEGRFRRADGEWRWLRSISQPRWGPNGEHAGFIGVAHDITEWKLANESLETRVEERTADLRAALDRLQAEVGERERAEEALRQAQKMEAVGQLTGGIAHDFNNLLTPVIGGLEILVRSLEEPRLRRVAETALESGRRGAKLTSQLLAFSRIQRIRMAPVRVNRVIETMQLMLKHTIGGEIEVRTALDPQAGLALCDENQLENAILNLAINARDAMPDGGVLTVSTSVTAEPDGIDLDAGDYVCIAVADTGQGMTAEVAARATEPFFSTKPLGKGTGLGLAQVYGIVRQSGGTLRIESREGGGTTVRLLLPRADGVAEAEQEEGEAAARGAEAAAAGARLFVVDDDAGVREFLAESLVSLGYRVETLDGAAAALAALADAPPDLMLIDFAMPGMNGAELAGEVRARFPGMPIVFVTGFAESDQLEGACGADVPVLRKPFGIDELAAMVADHLGQVADNPHA